MQIFNLCGDFFKQPLGRRGRSAYAYAVAFPEPLGTKVSGRTHMDRDEMLSIDFRFLNIVPAKQIDGNLRAVICRIQDSFDDLAVIFYTN